jgi:hypothetical protein
MPRYDESIEQQGFFSRLAKTPFRGSVLRDYCYAIPNAGTSGGRRALLAGVRRKAEGVTAGVPDIECMVAVPPFTGLHIEMKRVDGVPSDVTQQQKDVMARLTACGRKCVVAFGAGQAWEELCRYLDL